MTTQRTPEQILDLIRKVLALKSSDKAGEAAAAAAKAQELLFKYHLTMEDVDASQPGQAPGVEDESVDLAGKGHDGFWRMNLMFGVAKYNFCRAIRHAGTTLMFLVGTPTDIMVVKEVHRWIVEQLERMVEEDWRVYSGIDRKPTFRRAYFDAAVGVIRNRLYQQHESMTKATAQSTALVVRNDSAIAEYVKQHIGRTRSSHMAGAHQSYGGRELGHLAGGRVDLRPSKRLPGGGLLE